MFSCRFGAGAAFDFLDRSEAGLEDADPDTSGFQINGPVGESEFKVKVTATGGTERPRDD